MKSLKEWLPVIGMAFAAFVFNTTEFAPIGLLTDIAADFKKSEAQTGLLITIYAWVVAIASLPLMLLCARMEGRKLLGILFILFIGSHVLSYFATSFSILMISRIGVACAHSVFWSVASPYAVRIAPRGSKSIALGVLSGGTSIAMVLGLPLGRMIGLHAGWRMTFLIIAMAATVVMALLMYLLPPLPSKNSGSIRSLPGLLKRPALLWLYLLTAITITAHFTGYSYIEPFMHQVAGLSSDYITMILLLFGLAGICGSLLFSKYNDKNPANLMVLAIGCITIALLLLYPSAIHPYSLIALCLFWGISITLFNLVFQLVVIQLAPDATAVAMSIYSGIYNVGIGSGALVGGLVSTHANIADIGIAGAAIAFFSFLFSLLFLRSYLRKRDYKITKVQE